MSVEEMTMYVVACDRCRKHDENEDYVAWADAEQAIYSAEASEWLVTDEGQWCYRCIEWDEEADEMRPKPKEPADV